MYQWEHDVSAGCECFVSPCNCFCSPQEGDFAGSFEYIIHDAHIIHIHVTGRQRVCGDISIYLSIYLYIYISTVAASGRVLPDFLLACMYNVHLSSPVFAPYSDVFFIHVYYDLSQQLCTCSPAHTIPDQTWWCQDIFRLGKARALKIFGLR